MLIFSNLSWHNVCFTNYPKTLNMKKFFCLLSFLLQLSAVVTAQSATEYFENAMKYKQKENYTETAKLLGKALEIDPQNKSIKQEMADVQYLRKAFFESIPLYEEMLQSDSKNLIILARLSEMYSMSPKKMKAVEYAELALKLNPTDGYINKMLARTFYEVKHYPKAIAQYRIAEKALPKDMDIPFKLGFCCRNINNHSDAMACFERALQLDPGNGAKAYELANSCYDANYYLKATEYYQKAEDNKHYLSKGFYDNWAMSFVELKDYDKALLYYRKAKEFSPYDKDINLSIAETYMKKGDFAKSREVLDEMLQLNPNDAEVIYSKGMTYYKAGNTGKAESFFNQAFSIDPSMKSLRYTKSNF